MTILPQLIWGSSYAFAKNKVIDEKTLQRQYQEQKQRTYQNFINNNTVKTTEENPVEVAKKSVAYGANQMINCWDEAGKTYGIDPWLLFAYAKTESSFNPNAVNRNKSSIDRGIMQINSTWLPELSKFNISQEHLFDSCVSIYVGSWIIRQNINRYGSNYYGLVAYNVGNPFRPGVSLIAQNYYKKLSHNYNTLKIQYSPKVKAL